MASKTPYLALALLLSTLSMSVMAAPDEGWDAREARGVRTTVYPAIEHLPDFVQVKETFEKALSGDAASAPALMLLLRHTNEDVASTAAQALGRFPSPAVSSALQDSYATDTRVMVRVNALAGLARMKDSVTAPLALAALAGEDETIQGGGLGALEALGDKAHSASILQYLELHPEEETGDLLEALGRLGDPPGSTAVRDKLVGEANDKLSPFAIRYRAALGLKAMGLADLVKPIIDISKANNTNSSLIILKSAMTKLAAQEKRQIRAQADVDALLRDVVVDSRRRKDEWGRPLRAKFASEASFHVISDGPDMIPQTADDLSTAEALDAYIDRAFPDQFLKQ